MASATLVLVVVVVGVGGGGSGKLLFVLLPLFRLLDISLVVASFCQPACLPAYPVSLHLHGAVLVEFIVVETAGRCLEWW